MPRSCTSPSEIAWPSQPATSPGSVEVAAASSSENVTGPPAARNAQASASPDGARRSWETVAIRGRHTPDVPRLSADRFNKAGEETPAPTTTPGPDLDLEAVLGLARPLVVAQRGLPRALAALAGGDGQLLALRGDLLVALGLAPEALRLLTVLACLGLVALRSLAELL